MKKISLFLVFVFCFILSACSSSVPQDSDSGSTGTTESVVTSDTEDLAPAEYYLDIEPKKPEPSTGNALFQVQGPYVVFESMDEFRYRVRNQDFTQEQIYFIQQFDADKNGIRSIHPDKIYDVATPYDFDFDDVTWFGEEYMIMTDNLSAIIIHTKESFEKALAYDKMRYSAANKAFSDTRVEEKVVDGITKTITHYSTASVIGTTTWFTVREENRTIEVVVDSNSHGLWTIAYVEYDSGHYMYLGFPYREATLKTIQSFDIILPPEETNAELQ